MNALVSIVVATYNGEKFLRQQLESILNQTYSNLEIIVVDDGSTDETLNILQEYVETDKRINVYRSVKKLGFVGNFERGLLLTKGEYIALSDQDDVFRKDKIELLVDTLQANPKCDLVASDLSLIDANGHVYVKSMWAHHKMNPVAGHPFKRLVVSNFLTGCAIMVRRRVLNVALPFPADCLVHDWWLALTAARSDAGGICLVHQSLVFYRQHDLNTYGARILAPLTFNKIINRFFLGKKAEGGMVFRHKEIQLTLARLNGYLLFEKWTHDNLSFINSYIDAIKRLSLDSENSIFTRVRLLPGRLKYFFLAKKSLRDIAEIIYFSIFPSR